MVALLVAGYWAMAVSVSPRLGVTADEPGHLAAGFSYWRFNDYRLNPENGTLAMRIAAAPLLPMDLHFPALDGSHWQRSSAIGVADEFFFFLGNPIDEMLQRGRAGVALIGAFTLWLIWRWARGLFGVRAGWLALGLAMFCPGLLAHAGLATSDITVTACFLASLTAIWRVFHRVTWARLALAAVACGAAFTAKMSGVLIVPLIAALGVVRGLRCVPLPVALGGRIRWLRRRHQIFAATIGVSIILAAGSLIILWASYGFRYEGFNRTRSAAQGYYFSWGVVLEREKIPWKDDSALARFVTPHQPPAPTGLTTTVAWLREKRLLPEAFLWGFAHTLKFARERPAFFRGEFSKTGWRAFFPTAFVMKTPVATLLLLSAGVIALVRIRKSRSQVQHGVRIHAAHAWIYRSAPLLLFFGAYWLLALSMSLNIGHRHILPTYPIIYIFASAAVWWLARPAARWIAVGLAVAVGLQAVESVAARPFYLSYFQPLFGGPAQAYRTFVDSSLDWGQGLPDLATWQGKKIEAGDRAPLTLSFSGVDDPSRYAIKAMRFGDEHYDLHVARRSFPARVRGGWFAISATHFQRIYLPVRGPWTQAHEDLYAEIAQRLRASAAIADSANHAARLRDSRDFELLQFGRLCHFLRDRPPNDLVGGSILMFLLTDAEVNFALYAPLAEVNRALAQATFPIR